MKTIIASALVATYVAAQADDPKCESYDWEGDNYYTLDECFMYGNVSKCQYICDYGSCDEWWWASEIEGACDIAYPRPSFGQMLRECLEDMDVDVQGMIDFLYDKGYELEEMQMRHEQEVEDFFMEAGLEAEDQFADDAQKIQDAVIGAVQDWANSLPLWSSEMKRVEAKKRFGKQALLASKARYSRFSEEEEEGEEGKFLLTDSN